MYIFNSNHIQATNVFTPSNIKMVNRPRSYDTESLKLSLRAKGCNRNTGLLCNARHKYSKSCDIYQVLVLYWLLGCQFAALYTTVIAY